MGANSRQITINDSRMNITFKAQEEKMYGTAEPAVTLPDHLESIKDIFHELNGMIGLEKVKGLIFEIYAFLQIEKMRKEAGLKVNTQSFHMLFKGNPERRQNNGSADHRQAFSKDGSAQQRAFDRGGARGSGRGVHRTHRPKNKGFGQKGAWRHSFH